VHLGDTLNPFAAMFSSALMYLVYSEAAFSLTVLISVEASDHLYLYICIT
jgi:hypothetical protein